MHAFGRYTLVRKIGSGGMAEIWKAKTTGPSGFVKLLALKTILPEIADDATFVSMFIDEAKLVAGLVHPNIVQVFDFGEIDGRYFFAMEYVPGSDLRRLLDRVKAEGESLAPELAVFIALGACRGLGFAHTRTDAAGKSLGIVHRDISPQNILVSSTGDVKVGDFGIAKGAGASSRTLEGHVRGKIAYMSPEQLQTPVRLDARTDLFSLAAILVEMLTGSRLFAGSSTADVYAQLTSFKPEALDWTRVPAPLRATLVRALQPDRENRIATAAALEVELGEFLGVAGIQRAHVELGKLVTRLFSAELTQHAADETGTTGTGTAALPVADPGTATGPMPAGAASTSSGTLRLPGHTDPDARSPAAGGDARPPKRRFLVMSLVAVAALALLAVLWAGFGPDAGNGSDRGSVGAPVRGGTLRVALGYDTAATFDLFALAVTRNRFALQQVTEPLFKQSRTGDTTPWVVDEAVIEDGGRRIRLSLRPDLVFHDHPCFPKGKGARADGRDLAYSLREAIRAGRSPLPFRGVEAFRAGTTPEVAGITATDHGVTLEFDEPSPFYVAGIADVRLVPRILDGCENLARLKQPVGTGPFRFTAPQSPTGALRLVRAETYWRRDAHGGALPYADALELQSIPDLAYGLGRIGSADADGLDVLAPQRRDWPTIFDVSDARVKLAARYQALEHADAAVYSSRSRVAVFGMVATKADGPFRDARVRRAVAQAIDRPALIAAASHRPHFVPAHRFYDPRMLGYDPTLPALTRDPAAAARLLEEAGHPRGRGLRPIKLGVVNENKVADLIRTQLAPLGLEVETVLIPGSEIVKNAEAGTVDAILATNEWNMLDGEPSTVATEVQMVGRSAVIADLLRRLASTTERTDRIPVYREIEKALLDELPMVPISAGDGTQPIHLYVVHRDVQHFHDPVTGATKSELFDFSETWLDRTAD